MRFKQKWHQISQRFYFRYLPKLVDLLAYISTLVARSRIDKSTPVKVLIDNTVIGHGVTHESGWVSTEETPRDGDGLGCGYLARVPIHQDDLTSEMYRNVCALPGIVHLVKNNYTKLFSSAELNAERDRQPMGRYRGYNYFSYSLFEGIKFPSIDGFAPEDRFPSWLNKKTNPAKHQRDRLRSSRDQLYNALVELLGEKNSQDAWHLSTAEKHGLFCFLTMDFRFRRAYESHKNNKTIKSLTTRVMTPLEFAEHFQIRSIPPRYFSYHNASFFVRHDLSMPGGKRR